MSHYERERRDRESEREKLYRRRADPRGSLDELPYGDERPSGASRRRRADSPVDSEGSARMAKVRHISYNSQLQQRAPSFGNILLTFIPLQRSRRELTPRERSPPPRERRHRTRTPPAALPPKEEPAVHSGSEEGEIEE
jgi:pre-mRNA-processing factor 40